ncbi:hypothetical protein LJC04_02960 [Ruminococcaceae bacterium OttesenSCG-928-O06]|nr:hypothetical protein [Ruminococcaceae bacterium OttesenSCG-928-O06]
MDAIKKMWEKLGAKGKGAAVVVLALVMLAAGYAAGGAKLPQLEQQLAGALEEVQAAQTGLQEANRAAAETRAQVQAAEDALADTQAGLEALQVKFDALELENKTLAEALRTATDQLAEATVRAATAGGGSTAGGAAATSTGGSTVQAAPSTTAAGQVWIPQSGKKYHSNANCSGMNNPTQVTVEQAVAAGYEPCKRCY